MCAEGYNARHIIKMNTSELTATCNRHVDKVTVSAHCSPWRRLESSKDEGSVNRIKKWWQKGTQ